MGNFFSMMVCGLFCVFWLSFGMLQLPTVGIAASYSSTANATEGALSVGYNAGIGLYLIALGFTMFSFFIFTLKTNTVFALIFGLATATVFVLSSAYWHVALGNYEIATRLQHVRIPYAPIIIFSKLTTIQAGGALCFIVALLGWYMTFVMMAAETRLTVKLPVGDLSHFWPPTDVDLADLEKQE